MRTEHHIWCNFFNKDPAECKFCQSLEERFPQEGRGEGDMLKTYFPDAVPRLSIKSNEIKGNE